MRDNQSVTTPKFVEAFESERLVSPFAREVDHGGFSVRGIADRLGICLSALCVLHCLLTPFAIALIPAFQSPAFLSTGAHGVFHEGLLIVLPILAILAFVPGFKRHRDARVFYWSVPGLAFLLVATIYLHDDFVEQAMLSIPGSLLLIRAHWLNRSLCACCEAGHGRANSLARS